MPCSTFSPTGLSLSTHFYVFVRGNQFLTSCLQSR